MPRSAARKPGSAPTSSPGSIKRRCGDDRWLYSCGRAPRSTRSSTSTLLVQRRSSIFGAGQAARWGDDLQTCRGSQMYDCNVGRTLNPWDPVLRQRGESPQDAPWERHRPAGALSPINRPFPLPAAGGGVDLSAMNATSAETGQWWPRSEASHGPTRVLQLFPRQR